MLISNKKFVTRSGTGTQAIWEAAQWGRDQRRNVFVF